MSGRSKFLACFASLLVSCTYAETLSIQVTTEGPSEGVIAILVFKEKSGFPSDHEKCFRKDRFPVTSEGIITCTMTNMPYGDYSLSVLHDVNDNYKADKLLGFGPPKEPVGFSNIFKKLRKKPKFDSTVFSFTKEQTEVAVPLFYIF